MCISTPSMKCPIYVVLPNRYDDIGSMTLYAIAGSILFWVSAVENNETEKRTDKTLRKRKTADRFELCIHDR